MKELLALALPPLLGLTGMRLNELLFGRATLARHGAGLRFAFGLGTAMLVFSQLVVLGAVLGVSLAGGLAWTGVAWGAVELILRFNQVWPAFGGWRPRRADAWWLALLPVALVMGLTGLLAMVEGTLEYDALAFWVFKAKVMFLKQGSAFQEVHHNPLLTYAHWDYPLLVPGLYTLTYGLHGEVHEFTNKVWPFWMVTALLMSVLSVSGFAARPRLLPVAVVTILCFVRATTHWVRMEGATIPLTFYTVLAAMAAVLWLQDRTQRHLLGVTVVLLGGCVATKFEGAVTALMWGAVLGWLLWRANEWRARPLWLGALAAIVCLVPYGLFRASGPLLHPWSSWLQGGLEAPDEVVLGFPAMLLFSVGHRFFSATAFHWQARPDGSLQWAGKWDGLNTFVDDQTHLLAWAIVALAVLTWRRRPATRAAIGTLSAVVMATMLFLCFVLACVPEMRGKWNEINDFTNLMVGRYFNPLILAWFTGLLVPWLSEKPAGDTGVSPSGPLPASYAAVESGSDTSHAPRHE